MTAKEEIIMIIMLGIAAATAFYGIGLGLKHLING